MFIAPLFSAAVKVPGLAISVPVKVAAAMSDVATREATAVVYDFAQRRYSSLPFGRVDFAGEEAVR